MDCSSPNLGKQMYIVRFWQSRVLQPFITICAYRAKIIPFVGSPFRFVDNMTHRQADSPTAAERVWITCGESAHLAGISIPFKNPCAGLLRDSSFKRWDTLRCLHEVLIRLQTRQIFV